jgi:CubicO group peptidase (beta-lactamase class C family)
MLLVGCAPAAQAPEPPAAPAADTPAGGTAGSSPGRELRLVEPELVGMDSRKVAELDSIILRAILDGATPGAALAVGRHGRLVRLRGYGSLDWRAGFAPATDSSIYDLASLTKVVGTTTAAMILVEEGKLDLDAPVSRYLPEWPPGGDKRHVTIRHLLTHTSGLPAYAPLWRELRGREAYARRIGGMGLDVPPGTRTVYSDFGFLLLGFVIERQSGQTLDVFLRERVFEPFGMRDTGFNPRSWGETPMAATGHGDAAPERAGGGDILARIAPTEEDTFFRHTHVHGIVHDENAYALGGVAGHAGLFSSARDLAVFAQMMLNGGEYGGVRILDSATIARFTRRQGDASSRALGWDTPSGGANAGTGFSPHAFGHTGFTGTSIWIDPGRDLFVVLLTNRVNPTRKNNKHIALRKAVHETAVLAITDMPVTGRTGGGEP